MYDNIDTVKEGNRIKHYIVQDNSGKIGTLSKDNVVELINNKSITNAKIQVYNGSVIVRVKPIKQSTKKKVSNTLYNECKSSYTNGIVQSIKASHINTGNSIIKKLDNTQVGTPLKIRKYSYDDFEQVIYLGKQEIQCQESYTFFNGKNISGYFGITKRYILEEKELEIKFDDNDTSEVAFLLNYIKKGPFGLSNIL